jgi:hypothetical protein
VLLLDYHILHGKYYTCREGKIFSGKLWRLRLDSCREKKSRAKGEDYLTVLFEGALSMEKKLLFALDIGTRSVVGLVGEPTDDGIGCWPPSARSI